MLVMLGYPITSVPECLICVARAAHVQVLMTEMHLCPTQQMHEIFLCRQMLWHREIEYMLRTLLWYHWNMLSESLTRPQRYVEPAEHGNNDWSTSSIGQGNLQRRACNSMLASTAVPQKSTSWTSVSSGALMQTFDHAHSLTVTQVKRLKHIYRYIPRLRYRRGACQVRS